MELKLSRRDPVVLCLVRDGESYIDEFVEYYRTLGFCHICFLDNGSSDSTVEKACGHDCVTVVSSGADFKHQKLAMKWALMRLFGEGRWHLTVDIDEFFQYPFMDDVAVGELLEYLDEHGYTSMVAHLLDMTPGCSFGRLRDFPIGRIGGSSWYFNSSTIEEYDYDVPGNRLSNSNIKLWRGGVRKAVFGGESIVLTKHPLNFGDRDVTVPNSHAVGNRYVADISGLLLHYKFVGDIHARVRKAVEFGQYYGNSIEYRHYMAAFEERPDEGFLLADSYLYENHRQLLSHGLFEISAAYRDAVRH